MLPGRAGSHIIQLVAVVEQCCRNTIVTLACRQEIFGVKVDEPLACCQSVRALH